jgi:hypothetical protein
MVEKKELNLTVNGMGVSITGNRLDIGGKSYALNKINTVGLYNKGINWKLLLIGVAVIFFGLYQLILGFSFGAILVLIILALIGGALIYFAGPKKALQLDLSSGKVDAIWSKPWNSEDVGLYELSNSIMNFIE